MPTITVARDVIELWVAHMLGDTGRVSPAGYDRPPRKVGDPKEAQGYDYVCSTDGYHSARHALRRRFITCKALRGDHARVAEFMKSLEDRLVKSPCNIQPMYSEDGHADAEIRIASDHGVAHRLRSLWKS